MSRLTIASRIESTEDSTKDVLAEAGINAKSMSVWKIDRESRKVLCADGFISSVPLARADFHESCGHRGSRGPRRCRSGRLPSKALRPRAAIARMESPSDFWRAKSFRISSRRRSRFSLMLHWTSRILLARNCRSDSQNEPAGFTQRLHISYHGASPSRTNPLQTPNESSASAVSCGDEYHEPFLS